MTNNFFTQPDSISEAAHEILCDAVQFPDALSQGDQDTLKTILKTFPSGATFDKWSNSLVWEKRGGFSGETALAKTRAKLEGLGFKWSDGETSGLPTGSTSKFSTILINTRLGYAVAFTQFYGQGSSSNVFKLQTIKLAK